MNELKKIRQITYNLLATVEEASGDNGITLRDLVEKTKAPKSKFVSLAARGLIESIGSISDETKKSRGAKPKLYKLAAKGKSLLDEFDDREAAKQKG